MLIQQTARKEEQIIYYIYIHVYSVMTFRHILDLELVSYKESVDIGEWGCS